MGLACARIFSIRIEEETAHTRDLSIKGNNMKNKKMAVAGISLLGSIGVISTGFAGWIIGAPSQKGEGSGSITADGEVTTLGLETVAAGTGFGTGSKAVDSNIVFGASDTTSGKGWLTANLGTGNAKQEDLKAEYTFNVKVTNVSKITINPITFTESSGTYAKLADADSDNVLGKLPTLQNATSTTAGYITVSQTGGTAINVTPADNKVVIDTAKTADAKQVSIKFAIGFAWGGVFGHENPIVHYNKLEKADAVSDANTNLAKLEQLKNAQFTLSFTVSAE